jgi:glycosyltransferase involved in cell wall biosynthesis
MIRRAAFDARGHGIEAGGRYVWLEELAKALAPQGCQFFPLFDDQSFHKARKGLSPLELYNWYRRKRARLAEYRARVVPDALDIFTSVHMNYFPWQGVPRVFVMQDLSSLNTGYSHAMRRHYWRAQLRRIVDEFEGIVAISEYSAADLVGTMSVPRERIDVAPLGLAPVYLGRPLRQSFDPGGTVRFMFAGQHNPRKRLPYAVEIVAALRRRGVDARFRIVGPEAADTPRLKQTIADLDMAAYVILEGVLPFGDLLAAYEESDFLLWTSAYEGFGLPLAEAMAMGLPIFSVNNTTVPEVTGGQYVEIADADAEAAADAIVEALAAPEAISRRAVAAHALAQEYTWTRTADLTLRAWERAAAVRGR